MRAGPLTFLATIVACAAATLAIAAPDEARIDPIYPEARVPLVFSHAAHLGRDATLTCASCHAAATTSRSAIDVLMPVEAACRACHPIDRAVPDKVVAGAPPARCDACHVGFVAGTPPPRVHVPSPGLKFSHQAHAAAKIDCARCHAGVAADTAADDGWSHLPAMDDCLTCHDDSKAGAASGCATCHLSSMGTLTTELPDGPLVPRGETFGDAHDLAFAIDHARAAQRPDATCDSCHKESFCLDCHAGTVKPVEFHPGDYVMTHAVDARRGRPDCSTCHRQQTFCVACHERAGLAMRGDTDYGAGDGARFHPLGWEDDHGRHARADLDTCASCHREDDCAACHSAEVGAMRASPHGAGWAGSARCEALAKRNARMCLRCHTSEAEVGCDWTAF